MPITKKSDLDLDTFLHSVICLPIKEIINNSSFQLGDTNDIIFNLNEFLDFNPINLYCKLRVLSRTNGIIQDITFKFNLLRIFNIEFYIDFDFLFFFLIFSYFFFFSFFQNFVYISWKFVTFYCYALLI
jgi:hypothetical protein